MNEAIFLCGFMGAGKSSIGRALAKALGWPLLDTDALIEEEHGPIPQIFAEKGESYFRQLEAQLAKKLASSEKVIISTGGGFVLSEAVQKELKDSCVIYLDVPFETCWKRIRYSDRPLVKSNSKEQIHQLYLKRQEIYRSVARCSVDNGGDSAKTVAEILEKISWNTKSKIR